MGQVELELMGWIMKTNLNQIIGIILLITALHKSNAASVIIPNTFLPNTPAKASEVNANFSALATAVNANTADIAALQSSSSSNTGAMMAYDSTGKLIGQFLAYSGDYMVTIKDSLGAFQVKVGRAGFGSAYDSGDKIIHYLSMNCTGSTEYYFVDRAPNTMIPYAIVVSISGKDYAKVLGDSIAPVFESYVDTDGVCRTTGSNSYSLAPVTRLVDLSSFIPPFSAR